MTASLSDTLRTTRAQAVADAINLGSGPGKLLIYDGTRPANGAAATSQVVLLSTTFSDPCETTVAAGTLTFNTINGSVILATSTATWARVTDSDDNFIMDMDVGVTGSGDDIEVTNTSFVAGGVVTFDSGVSVEV